MLAAVASAALWLAEKLFGFAEKRSTDAVENFRTKTGLDIEQVRANTALASEAASIIRSAQQHWVYWVAWSMAALPASAWFGWGMMDSLFNGALPDVAELPPQLLKYFDVVFANVFFAGTALGATQIVASAIARRK